MQNRIKTTYQNFSLKKVFIKKMGLSIISLFLEQVNERILVFKFLSVFNGYTRATSQKSSGWCLG